MDGISQAFEATPALFIKGATFARTGDFMTPKPLKKFTLCVQIRQRGFKDVSDPNRHTPAWVEVAVGLNCNQVVTCSTEIGFPSADQELQRTAHKNLGIAEALLAFTL